MTARQTGGTFRERVGARAWRGDIAFTITERSADKVVGRMAVTEGMLNPFGTVHAGAMIWFADVVATQCAVGDFETLDESGRGFPLAVDLHTVLLANQSDGELEATARPLRRGRRLSVIRTEVRGRDGRVLIEMTTTHLSAT